jgi:hypothetical protein
LEGKGGEVLQFAMKLVHLFEGDDTEPRKAFAFCDIDFAVSGEEEFIAPFVLSYIELSQHFATGTPIPNVDIAGTEVVHHLALSYIFARNAMTATAHEVCLHSVGYLRVAAHDFD